MSRSTKEKIQERLRRRYDPAHRLVPMWVMFRVYKRNPHYNGNPDETPIAIPDYWIPKLEGGLWDRRLGAYVQRDAAGISTRPAPWQIHEIAVTPEQAELLALEDADPETNQWLILAGPGSGKTRTLTILAIRTMLRLPYQVQGNVGATADRVEVMWDDVLELVPDAWIDEKKEAKGRYLRFANRHKFEYKTALAPSRLVGTAIQGKNWAAANIDEQQNIHDRALKDVLERGRRRGKRFRTRSTATNFGVPFFEERKRKYMETRHHRVIRYNPFRNVFVELDYWERLKPSYSPSEYRRRVLAQDVADEHKVYPRFSWRETLRPLPVGYEDVTAVLTKKKYGKAFPFIGGTDWGELVNATVVLKVFKEPNTGKLLWWAVDEITTRDHAGADVHALRILDRYSTDAIILICDPGINTKDPAKSDYVLARKVGFRVEPAMTTPPLSPRHRIDMHNALLEDATGVPTKPGDKSRPGKRRFFVACTVAVEGTQREHRCRELVRSFVSMEKDEFGLLEPRRKDRSDRSHWPAAAQFGMFPWEQLAALTTFQRMTGSHPDPLVAESMRYAT